MNQVSDFLLALGGLHDAVVVAINWQIEFSTLEIMLDDFYANFRGSIEYPGRHKASIKLEGISQIDFDVKVMENLRIFEILPVENQTDEVIARFSPSGSLRVRFTSAIYPDPLI